MSAEQRVAVVTGASRGLGLETVRVLAEQLLPCLRNAQATGQETDLDKASIAEGLG